MNIEAYYDYICSLKEDELLELATKEGIEFDWDAWLSPRFKLIEALMEGKQTK